MEWSWRDKDLFSLLEIRMNKITHYKGPGFLAGAF
ncbi:hypothetical protein SAMN05216474_1096 [Lishizhenia tianjinensis]|uniref:Uncharacterized protein n=1 Tax=Lishizhenia tianjinensis TaxID=477690 RepID=A0A1I6YQP4_9FLAO|nr:hypothetical protein SAMN05216474_1096 [Lishizhenia tianjinensis]